ncbi:hypothetical protein DSO57_1023254 [Entomophthora muscae]|uniref:Uncharacterized protein n=1 Tax=Entomophthora muscae TaxID=34485 RepID=A0ACC2S523_9FUNG|nr:hypothetical protein DSO57_1023254 [Entomophthora muscae]
MGICFPTNGLRQPPHPSKQTAVRNMKLNTYTVTKPTTTNPKSTWELLSNLTNAQEAIQFYLNKKNWEGESSGKEGDDVRIDNFPPLEPQAQEQELNPESGLPQAARPEDRKTNCPHFSGIEPLQADVEGDNPPRKVD